MQTPSDGFDNQVVCEFVQAKALLDKLLQVPEIKEAFDFEERPNAKMIYSEAVTIWLLILQRLQGGASMSKIVTEVTQEAPRLFPDNIRVRENRVKENTSSYSRARSRLSIAAIEKFSRLVCNHLAENSRKSWNGRRVFILDGTTITFAPTSRLKKAFPPSHNQYGKTVWPIAMLLVAAELETGCILVPKIDAMYGEENSSEAKQAREIFKELPQNSVIMADSGFGIFSVAYSAMANGHDFSFRVTAQRFKSYLSKATLILEEAGSRCYSFLWTPSKYDHRSTPDLPKGTELKVFLHEYQLADGKVLTIVTSLDANSESLKDLYQRRYDIEFDIRDLKVTMDMEHIRAKSLDSVMKEFHGSVIAFNLVTQFRRVSAEKIEAQPRRLSFIGVWQTFQTRLLRSGSSTYQEWERAFEAALASACSKRLPVRKKPRSYPRVAHRRRQKSVDYRAPKSKRKSDSTPPSAIDPGEK